MGSFHRQRREEDPTLRLLTDLTPRPLSTGLTMSAAALKAEGNEYFANKDWQRAIERYSQSLTLVEESDIVSKTALLSNRSACYIKLLQFEKGE